MAIPQERGIEMGAQSTSDRVKAVVSKLTAVPAERIGDHQPLDHSQPDGLDLDSLDRIQLAMELEEAFGIEISDDDVDAIDGTVAGIVAYLERREA